MSTSTNTEMIVRSRRTKEDLDYEEINIKEIENEVKKLIISRRNSRYSVFIPQGEGRWVGVQNLPRTSAVTLNVQVLTNLRHLAKDDMSI